jgi:hypothetical protein
MNNNRRRAELAGTVLLSAFSLGATPVQAAGDCASGSPQRVIVVMRDRVMKERVPRPITPCPRTSDQASRTSPVIVPASST